MKRKLIEFASLAVMLFLFNVLSHIVGIVFVNNFDTYVYSHIKVLDELLMIVCFTPFLLLAIRFHKKGGIFIFSIINILLGFTFLYNDTMGYGGEVVSTFVFTVSKLNHFISVILPNNLWQKINLTIIWGCYIVAVGYLYLLSKNKIMNIINLKQSKINRKEQMKTNN